jgi:hypothetical protein
MFWFVAYLSVAPVIAVIAFALPGLLGTRYAEPFDVPVRPGLTAVVAGLLWPALIVGAAELVVLWLVKLLAAQGKDDRCVPDLFAAR